MAWVRTQPSAAGQNPDSGAKDVGARPSIRRWRSLTNAVATAASFTRTVGTGTRLRSASSSAAASEDTPTLARASSLTGRRDGRTAPASSKDTL
ncbi:hypothetical protein [Streptomyces sp. NPDC057428]|uniref:hypothetical protein n=1 Tax=Streptomyces sp. NPDC057428 TaxID=3346129 RepID=UPI0036AADDD8